MLNMTEMLSPVNSKHMVLSQHEDRILELWSPQNVCKITLGFISYLWLYGPGEVEETDDSGRKIDDSRQKIDDRRQKINDRRQMISDRRRETEDR